MRKHPLYRRGRRRALIAGMVVCLVLIAVPAANYVFYDWARGRAYSTFVAPQLGAEVVTLSSRILPRYKYTYLTAKLAEAPSGLILVYGNSSQFHIRETDLRGQLRCETKPFYNMSHHSLDYVDARHFFSSIISDVNENWTVLLGTYPDMFTKIARSNAPSIDHPWNNLALWVSNLRDGNTSISSLFPRLLNIEWPLTARTWFPFIRQYEDTFDLAMTGAPDEYLYPDGSVQFFDADQRRLDRVASGQVLDADNIRLTAARLLNSPFDPRLLAAFQDTVAMLIERGATVITYEVELTEYLGGARWSQPRHAHDYLAMMKDLDRQFDTFRYLDRESTWTHVPERYWLDGSHVSFAGGEKITRRLVDLIGDTDLCTASTGPGAD